MLNEKQLKYSQNSSFEKRRPSVQPSSKQFSNFLNYPTQISSLQRYSFVKTRRSQNIRSSQMKTKIFEETRNKNLTPDLKVGNSSLLVDTSPSPKIRFRVKLPSLKFSEEIEESDWIKTMVSKVSTKTPIEREDVGFSHQETQTDSSLEKLIRDEKWTTRQIQVNRCGLTVLKGKDISKLLENFPLTPTPELKSSKEVKIFKKSLKTLKPKPFKVSESFH